MPIYEFVCETCGRPFEELVSRHSAIPEVRCPNCGSASLRRKVSTFASRVAGSGNSNSLHGGSSCSVGGT